MYRGVIYALLAAVLFGASTPFAKAFVSDVHPLLLAGLLYAGSGAGLAVALLLRRALTPKRATIAWPARGEWRWLAAAIVFGGVLGPVLLMFGLAATSASTASLLLNLEAVFSALLAWFLFHESYDRRIALGMAAIVAGSVVLSFTWGETGSVSPGAALVVAACLCWALDNNLTRKVAASDAILIAGLKGIVAAAVNLGLALGLGYAMPSVTVVAQAAVVGFLGYGLSLVLFVLALRHLGTARAGAYFAAGPFVGAIVAVAFFGDTVTLPLLVAALLMGFGIWLHLTERHDHEHVHEAMDHVHVHRHDEHHQHSHRFDWDGAEPHTHAHGHPAKVHRHRHFPDVHHRHPHG